jgi:hypothetical protein
MPTTSRGLLAAFAALALCTVTPLPALSAQTLTFDDRPLAQPVTPLTPAGAPTTYGGFEFFNAFVNDDADIFTSGAGAVSGTQYAYVGHGVGFGELYRPSGTFTYLQGFFGVRSVGELLGTPSVILRGYDAGGTEIFTQALALTTTPTFHEFAFGPIDALEIDTRALDADPGVGLFVMDDVSTVPEPGTIVLLVTGLAGIAVVARVRRRAA